jgi:pseudoazurin
MKLVKYGVAIVALTASVSAIAAEITVTAGARDFSPPMEEGSTYGLVKAQPGDTIVWKNMASGGHNTKSLGIPEGATAWDSKLGEDFHVTVDKLGAYVYQCTPHATMGLLGVILVGDGKPANLDALLNSSNGIDKRMGKKIAKMFP